MSTPVSSRDVPSPSSTLVETRGPLTPGRALKLVVLVPCLNEERTVAEVVGGVPRDLAGVGSVEILVMDDGSTDGTAEKARQAGARVVSHRVNLGLGRAHFDFRVD